MRDYLAWRLAFGVATPSTNTVVQPEYDDMRPPGVTNHLARMAIDDIPVRSNEDFEELLRLIDLSLEDAVARAMDAKPNAFILGNPDFLSAEELADIVLYCWKLPAHICVRDIVVTPTRTTF